MKSKQRTTLILVILISLFTVNGCNNFGIHGSGIIKDEQRDINDFDAIDVGGFYDIEIKCGEKPNLVIIGDDNLIPIIKTEVRGNTLHIWNKKNISTRRKIKIKITTGNLTSINSSGASKIFASNINSDDFTIDASGACNLRLSGNTEALTINSSGASNINAERMKAKKVSVNLSGASHATVYSSDELRAEISGIGVVNYSGNPKIIKKRISGLGSINQN
jgi:hypothetical protein